MVGTQENSLSVIRKSRQKMTNRNILHNTDTGHKLVQKQWKNIQINDGKIFNFEFPRRKHNAATLFTPDNPQNA